MFHVKQFVIVLDQLLNVLAFGWADETISARAWRCQWWLRHVIDLIFFWEVDENGVRNHCKASYDYVMARMCLPPEYRLTPNCIEEYRKKRRTHKSQHSN